MHLTMRRDKGNALCTRGKVSSARFQAARIRQTANIEKGCSSTYTEVPFFSRNNFRESAVEKEEKNFQHLMQFPPGDMHEREGGR